MYPVAGAAEAARPKSLLRHKLAVSTLEELSEGQFELVVPEVEGLTASKVKRIVLCSGKVYYDLLERRQENEQTDVAIIRIACDATGSWGTSRSGACAACASLVCATGERSVREWSAHTPECCVPRTVA